LPIFGAYDPSALKLAMDGIPAYERSILISNPQLGHDLAAALGSKSVCLLRGHGITATGSSIEEATLRAISLNELAEMNYRAAGWAEEAGNLESARSEVALLPAGGRHRRGLSRDPPHLLAPLLETRRQSCAASEVQRIPPLAVGVSCAGRTCGIVPVLNGVN